MKYYWYVVLATVVILLLPGFISPREYGVLAFFIGPVVGIEIIIIGILSLIYKE